MAPKKSGQSVSLFHGNGEPLYLLVFTQFRTENRFTLFLELLSLFSRNSGRGYGEVAEPYRFALFLELLLGCGAGAREENAGSA